MHSSHEIWNFLKKWSLTGGSTPTSSSVAVSQAAYSSASIPGTIQAENYDLGGAGVAYQDNDQANNGNMYRTDGVDITGDAATGYKIGWTIQGEWLEYTLNVAVAGAYAWEVSVAAGGDGSSFRLLLDSTLDLTGLVEVPNTGSWDVYSTLKGSTPSLTAGKHILRLLIEGSYVNVDWVKFSEAPTPLLVQPKIMLKKNNVPYYELGRGKRLR